MQTDSAVLRSWILIATILVLPTSLNARAAAEKDGNLSVAAVQFAVSGEVYESSDSFRAVLLETLKEIENQAASEDFFPDLVVFPEYTSAFLGLSILSDDEITSIRTKPAANRMLIFEALIKTHQDMLNVWKDISAEKDYAILAGTTLTGDSMNRIHNRALIFRGGDIIWTQDKVFPGAPEKAILNLSMGRVEDAQSLDIDGFDIVITICRDTYNEVWEQALPPADLWIDIKANEIPYTREYYDGALPSRLPGSPVNRGLTVSLSGEILGFRFTGPTEYLDDRGPVSGTDPYRENSILLIELPESLLRE